jgi:tetratricopeptide (TPR) repeat protein
MEKHPASDSPQYLPHVVLLVILTFIAGRIFGGILFDNNWSFIHWQHLPVWYIAVWFMLLGLVGLLLAFKGEKIAGLFTSPGKAAVALIIILAGFVIFQFDSFLYSGGNLRVAQIAQVERVIYRWFEYGSILIVSWLDGFFNLFQLHYNKAGVYAWKTFALVCTVLSLIGSLRLVRELTVDATKRFFLFIILFFGPQTILYFCFVGVEPVIVTISVWVALLAVKLSRRFSFKYLISLWVLVVFGVFVHFTLTYLVPTAVYATVFSSFKKRRSRAVALVAGLATYFGLVLLCFYWAGRNLEFSRFLLFWHGKNPHADYGLFSARHIGDMAQLLFLASPLIIVAVYLVITRYRTLDNRSRTDLSATLLMALAGITMVFILDPPASIVLDFPRLTAYLFPLGLLLAVSLKDLLTAGKIGLRPLSLIAASSLILPLSYLPSYLSIAKADPYVTEYLEKHDSFYYTGCLAFRDAYFYRKELHQADAWEWKLPIKSPDYLNLRGCKDLSLTGEDAEAIRSLNKMIVQNPYWPDPRTLLASIQLKLGRYQLAKPQIDTCLMLEPYKKEHLINLYRYYRDSQNYPEALKSITRALEFYPKDADIKTDLMIVYYRSGAFETADSLANVLLTSDSSLAYPYLIKGFVAEVKKRPETAIQFYKKFISLAPDEPETPAIREKLDKLTSEQQQKQQADDL